MDNIKKVTVFLERKIDQARDVVWIGKLRKKLRNKNYDFERDTCLMCTRAPKISGKEKKSYFENFLAAMRNSMARE